MLGTCIIVELFKLRLQLVEPPNIDAECMTKTMNKVKLTSDEKRY